MSFERKMKCEFALHVNLIKQLLTSQNLNLPILKNFVQYYILEKFKSKYCMIQKTWPIGPLPSPKV